MDAVLPISIDKQCTPTKRRNVPQCRSTHTGVDGTHNTPYRHPCTRRRRSQPISSDVACYVAVILARANALHLAPSGNASWYNAVKEGLR